jgi:hypothetical protein
MIAAELPTRSDIRNGKGGDWGRTAFPYQKGATMDGVSIARMAMFSLLCILSSYPAVCAELRWSYHEVYRPDVERATLVDVGDLDGDKDPDVLAVSTDSRIVWCANNGSGQFGPQQAITASAGRTRFVHAIDMDADHDLDVLSFSQDENAIIWYRNDGSGRFSEQRRSPVSLREVRSLCAGDLDGNRDMDMLFVSGDKGAMVWYENDGSGQFGRQRPISASANDVQSADLVDLDGDGDLDVLAIHPAVMLAGVSSRASIVWYENNGTGRFSDTRKISTSLREALSAHAVDMDGDGDLDVLSTQRYFRRSPGARFEPLYETVWYENEGSGRFSNEQTIVAGKGVAELAYAADLDGDRDAEVLSAAGRLVLYENNGSGEFGFKQEIDTSVASLFIVDVDGDRDRDILLATSHNETIAWYENDGSGRFGYDLKRVTGSAERVQSMCPADLDGDGHMDVVSVSSGDTNRITWFKNDGSGQFGSQRVVTTSAYRMQPIYIEDLDGDGDRDILSASPGVVGGHDDKIVWFENEGSGLFSGEKVITSLVREPKSVYAADLDGDGDLDVLSASSRMIAWHKSDGHGLFSDLRRIADDVDGAECVYAADLDGDGDCDVLSASSYFGDNKIAWYENDGSGQFGEQRLISTKANRARSVCAADFDGDGDYDVLSTSEDKVAWYENDGSGHFSDPRVISTLIGSVDPVDLDRDGDIDVLITFFSNDKIVWYENEGSGRFSGQKVIAASHDGPVSACATDMDGDGDLDVLSAFVGANKIAWFENEGFGRFDSEAVAEMPSRSNQHSADSAGKQGPGEAALPGDDGREAPPAYPGSDGIAISATTRLILANPDEIVGRLKAYDDLVASLRTMSATEAPEKTAWLSKRVPHTGRVLALFRRSVASEFELIGGTAVAEGADETADLTTRISKEWTEVFDVASRAMAVGQQKLRGQSGQARQSSDHEADIEERAGRWITADRSHFSDLSMSVYADLLYDLTRLHNAAEKEKASKTLTAIDNILLRRDRRYQDLVQAFSGGGRRR